MAQSPISEEIDRHVEAVLAVSKREILWRLMSEAELCIDFDQTSAAAILAGLALEELFSVGDSRINEQPQQIIQAWRELRNRAAHPASRGNEVDPKAVAAMVMGIRAMLGPIMGSHDRPQHHPVTGDALTRVRGKYAFVPTSVDDFLKRKREDVEFENRQ